MRVQKHLVFRLGRSWRDRNTQGHSIAPDSATRNTEGTCLRLQNAKLPPLKCLQAICPKALISYPVRERSGPACESYQEAFLTNLEDVAAADSAAKHGSSDAGTSAGICPSTATLRYTSKTCFNLGRDCRVTHPNLAQDHAAAGSPHVTCAAVYQSCLGKSHGRQPPCQTCRGDQVIAVWSLACNE